MTRSVTRNRHTSSKGKADVQTRLARRKDSKNYYYRQRIPSDLRDRFGRKREVWVTLGTADRSEGARLARRKAVEWDQHFDELRRGPATSITPEETAHIISKMTSRRMGADEEGRVQGLSDFDFERHLQWLLESEEAGTQALSRGQFAFFEGLIDDNLQGHGYDLPKDSEGYRRFAYEFVKAYVRINEQMRERDRGKAIDTPPMPAERSATKGATQGLQRLLDKWNAERKPTPKSLAEWKQVVRTFGELHGDLPVPQITKAHVVAYKDRLVADGDAPGTIKKKLGALHALFEYGIDNAVIEVNPAKRVKVQVGKVAKEARLPYDVDDLRVVFSSPVYAKGYRPRGGAGEAAFWLPLLATFTGARLEELGQALVTDIKRGDDCVYLEITDRDDEQQVKTEGSRRRVPLHDEVLQCGFMAYVEERKRSGKPRLFPALRPDVHGQLTGNWSKWYGRYARALGITDKRKVFHSYRHSFKHFCRESGISEDVHDALTGHANGAVGRDYAFRHFPLSRLAEAMRQFRIAGLDLAGLRDARVSQEEEVAA